MARVAIALLAALCCAAAAAAADVKHMTADNLVASKSVKAKTASGYYDNTEMACMNQMNFKNCRYTGCPVENFFSQRACNGGGTCETCEGLDPSTPCKFCAPDSIYFQTDFTCCQKGHEYYGQNHDIGLVGFNDKIGTCDWEISLYRTWWDTGLGEDAESDSWMPHLTDDGTALKWGTAWGTCYLNAEAEHCDSPLCERMAINIQGGLYATCAYSSEPTQDYAPMQEFCAAEPPPFPLQTPNQPRQGESPAKTPAAKQFTPGDILEGLTESPLATILFYIEVQSLYYLADKCGFTNLPPRQQGISGREFSRQVMKQARGQRAGKAKIMYDDYHEEKYYPGLGLVVSGPMSVASKKDHKLEETGMYEFTMDFVTFAEDTVSPNNRWPIVRSRGAKVRFTHEQDEYYQGGSSK